MKAKRFFRKLLTALLAVAGGVVILLAIAVGGFRLAMTQLPTYQAELQAWVNESLGLRLDYDALNARWGLRGPELTFRDVAVATAGGEEPFLVAEEARVVIDPWTALADRQLRIGRLTFERTRLTVVREPGGPLHLLGAPAGREARLDLALVVPPGIQLGVRNSSLVYDDREHGVSWTFGDVDLDLARSDNDLTLEASARPPAELASRFELSAQSDFRGPNDLGNNWRLFAEARDLDLGALAPALPAIASVRALASLPAHGTGDAALSLEWTGGELARGRLETSLEGVDWERRSVADAAGRAPDATRLDTDAIRRAADAARAAPDVARRNADATRRGANAARRDSGAAAPPAGNGAMPAAAVVDGYRRLVLTAEWQRNASGGWHVALDDVDLDRGRPWPSGTGAAIEITHGAEGIAGFSVRADFVRLDDLEPLIRSVPASPLSARWMELSPHGELSAVELSAARRPQDWDYSAAGSFSGFGLAPYGRWPGFRGVSGELRADSSSGRVSFATHGAELDWRRIFRQPLAVDELSGVVVWRKGFDGMRIVGDDLVVATRDGETRTSLELTLPVGGGSPLLDLKTRVGAFDVAAAKHYLPVHKMPPAVVAWLDRALAGGRATSADVRFLGPLGAFPFDGGEGQFRAEISVENAVLDYVAGWPRAVDLDGAVEFVNAGFSAHGTGHVLGNVGRSVSVVIPDLRSARLTLHADTEGPLADVLGFLQKAPPLAERLGPGYERLHALAGRGAVALDLTLPLKDLSAYRVASKLHIMDGTLGVDGFAPQATEIDGTLELADGALHATGIKAIFLDGPVTADVVAPPANVPGYRAELDFVGEVTADAVAHAFHLPFADFAAGQTRWRGELLIPAQTDDAADAPLKVEVASNLSGVALSFPAPFAKAPADPVSLELGIELPDRRHARLKGHLGATRRFALELEDMGDGARLVGGALRFGGAEPVPPADGGLVVDGSLPTLHFDDWLAVMRRSAPGAQLANGSAGELFEQADLDITDFRVFGQELGMSRLSVQRGDAEWNIGIDSAAVAGRISVPRDLASRPQIVARMQRLYLERSNDGGDERGSDTRGNDARGDARAAAPVASVATAGPDPRKLVGLSLEADAFGFGGRRFGSVSADVQADPEGLRLVSFESKSDAFAVQGRGGWFVGPDGPVSRLSFTLDSGNVAAALEDLALEPIASGKKAQVTADVEWPGAPSPRWLQHVGGEVSMRFENGSLLDIDPGAGRVVGLMSISALPRRLALDFRDVFNKGLVFDEIKGDFLLADGSAYTNNLKVAGPAAEIGLAGRVGLRERDFAQQAVVTAEPGKMLPTVGGLIGGPGVGAALLIFTRIFKEPLKGIGRASYCITGGWDAPKVERLSAEQLQQGRICAELPPQGLPQPDASN